MDAASRSHVHAGVNIVVGKRGGGCGERSAKSKPKDYVSGV
jgi:hypothetical protein